MAKKAQADEVLTYRVRPTAGGRYYTFAKYNVDGEEVEVSPMFWPSEADAEKAARSQVYGSKDVLAVSGVKSVDKDDNINVVIEKDAVDESDQNFGMAVKTLPRAENEGDNDFRPVDPGYTPAMKAVDEGNVAPAAQDATPTDAEQKAIDKAQAKADKEVEAEA